jgi:glycosyltransferase involved in cell wall biosynthesis
MPLSVDARHNVREDRPVTERTAPQVSVVIPAFNAAAFIERTLDSVRAQTWREYEIVVVDDGSSDETAGVVGSYLSRHCLNGRCLRQKNRGIAGARNAGMEAAGGTFVALLDHDDIWYADKLAVVMREFEGHPESDLVYHREHIVRDGKVVRVSQNQGTSGDMYRFLLLSGNRLSPSATVFRRDKALSIGGFREDRRFDTAEDYDFWLRLSQVGKFRFVDRVLGEYQLVDGAASGRVEYHHANLENVLRDHFLSYFGASPKLLDRWRMRRRLSMVYRSAATHLNGCVGYTLKQHEYLLKMMRTFPFEPKNVARFLTWGAR